MQRFTYLFLLFFAMLGSSQVRTPEQEALPTGMSITPTASPKSVFQALNPDLPDLPQYTVDHPVSTAVSPDGTTLLILTSGYNLNHDANNKVISEQSNEYVFVYDITQGAPVKKQVLQVPNTFVGLAWNPNGEEFYVSGGKDDSVHIFEKKSGQWAEASPPVALSHKEGLGGGPPPVVAGLAVNSSGSRLLVANYENDSVSLVDLKSRQKITELDMRPGKINPQQSGVPGGEYPYAVAYKGDDRAYVSSVRDREIVVLDVHASPTVVARIKLKGQPNKLLLNKAQTLLFVAEDNSDLVSIIATANDRVVASIRTTAPDSVFPNEGTFKGSNPNSLALSPDEHTLYVTNGGTNSVAVIRVDRDPDDSRLEGLIPTGWYPNAVSVNRDGSMLYVVNGKGNAGPNPKACYAASTTDRTCWGANQYILQLMKGGFLVLPRPSGEELAALTLQVAKNNHFPMHGPAPVDPVFGFLHKNIKHVIYIVKENRSYDQVLGDLEKGNGDPTLAMLKEPITPNHHQLARQFVTLDNFFESGEVSGTGWPWSTSARANDYVEKTIPLTYADRADMYDSEGPNRSINVALPTLAEREKFDPQVKQLPDPAEQLPGTAAVAAPDGPEDAIGAGYLWDSALRAKLTVRNYGFFAARVETEGQLERDPAAKKITVAVATNERLHGVTDPYFHAFDQRMPDYWRFKEWEREFDGFVKDNNMPNLQLVRLAHDHFGDFAASLDGVNTVETQMADNDYSVGLLVEKVAHSKYAADTLIFVVEDDAQAGPDHVDAHRSCAFVVGPYVKQGPVISQRYNTVALLRTIEEILGMKPLGLNDALQAPMAAVFSPTQKNWTYTTRVPQSLRSTQLPLPPATGANTIPNSSGAEFKPAHDAAYWEEQTKGFDFSAEDRIDSEQFNLVLWKGLMGDKPYPVERSGSDLRAHRRKLLKHGHPIARR